MRLYKFFISEDQRPILRSEFTHSFIKFNFCHICTAQTIKPSISWRHNVNIIVKILRKLKQIHVYLCGWIFILIQDWSQKLAHRSLTISNIYILGATHLSGLRNFERSYRMCLLTWNIHVFMEFCQIRHCQVILCSKLIYFNVDNNLFNIFLRLIESFV